MFKKYAYCRAGNVAVLFSILTFPLLAGVAVSLEYANISAQRAKLQNAVDAAVLFAGRYLLQNDELPLQSDVEGFVESNFSEPFTIAQFNQSGGRLNLSVDSTIPAYFFGSVYPEIFDQQVSASVPFGGKSHLEIALVLDSTGSMDDDGKMSTLKTVANNFIDKMDEMRDTSNEIKIGVVPYASYVNVGRANKYASWMAGTGRFWQGCVRSRPAPDTLVDGAISIRFRGTFVWGCPTALLPLTEDSDQMKSTISSMKPAGYTYIAEGVMWGLRVLSPAAPFTEGKSLGTLPSTTSHRKIMLILTDGDNTIAPNLPGDGRHTLIADEDDDDDEVLRIANANTREACEEARDAGVMIFAVALGTDVSEKGEAVLRDCAQSADRYYVAVDASELHDIFDDFLSKIVTLRLSS